MYKVLYRKWRPSAFSDVVGQEHVTKTLEGEIISNRLSHAYLFTGSRGTGKTTCAKILSKAVNCLNPREGNPCNECEICSGIDSGSVLDVVEIDAASNRGIDDIRALREEAVFTPGQAKFRVYIIDEVHMLTIEAFNALLKTLEEPPQHVIFILATTEVQKLPSTILSRCQRFDFRRIEPDSIANRLIYIAKEEGALLQYDAAVLIARIADGALRDALSLLDRCISSLGDDKNIDLNHVRSCAGIVGRDYLFRLSDAVFEKNPAKALSVIDTLHKASLDAERFCSELINHFRNLMIIKSVKNPEELIISTADEMDALKQHASRFSLEVIIRCIDVLSAAAESLRKRPNGRIEIETAMIRLCSKDMDDSNSALLERISALETIITAGSFPSSINLSVTDFDSEKAEMPLPPKMPDLIENEDFTQEDEPLFEEKVFETAQNDEDIPPQDEAPAFGNDMPFGEEDETGGTLANDAAPFGEEEETALTSADDDAPFGEVEISENNTVSIFAQQFAEAEEKAEVEPDEPPAVYKNEPPADARKDKGLQEIDENGRIPDGLWKKICEDIIEACPPLLSMVKGVSAVVQGDLLIFKTPNPMVNMILGSDKSYTDAIANAVHKNTGKTLSVRVEFSDDMF